MHKKLNLLAENEAVNFRNYFKTERVPPPYTQTRYNFAKAENTKQ